MKEEGIVYSKSDIVVKKVTTKREIKDFLDFANKMYKGNICYTPPLYSEEKRFFSKDNVYLETCETEFFNAYSKSGKMLGRIQGIIQHASNEKMNEKRARFSHFDAINQEVVANCLFEAVEKWAISKGCDTMCGPMGFSDLEREGLLIEGFDQLNTYEEQYNYPYYANLIESQGYEKDIDWVEFRLFKPTDEKIIEKIKRIKKKVMEKYNLKMAPAKNTNDFVKKYGDDVFKILDMGYAHLYGTVPFTEKLKNQMLDQFGVILSLDYVCAIVNQDDEVVAFGLCYPAIGDTTRGTNGKLYPWRLLPFLHSIKHPKHLDLALIAVNPKYKNLGFNVLILDGLINLMEKKNIEYCETNLCMETNYRIQAQWKYFPQIQHKRRRAYVKKLVK